MIPIVGDIIEGLLGRDGPVGKLVSLIPDPNERARQVQEIRLRLLDISAASDAQQAEINKTEAASSSVFVAGWRPAVGWICASALAWQYVVDPILTWILAVVVSINHAPLPPLPSLNNAELMNLVLSMLGFGAYRTYEKLKNVSRESDPK